MPTQQIGLLRTISLEASRLIGSQLSLFGLRLCCSDSRLDLKLACHTKWPGQLPLSLSFAYSHFSVRIFELLSGRFSNAKLARMFNSLIFAVVCLCVGVASGRSTRLSSSCLGGKVFQLAGGLLVVTLVSPTARSTFSSQNAQNTSARTKFFSSHVEKWHAAVARSTFASQNTQNTSPRTDFGSFDVEKCYAAVARSSQNVQHTTCSHHLSKLRCRKIRQLIS